MFEEIQRCLCRNQLGKITIRFERGKGSGLLTKMDSDKRFINQRKNVNCKMGRISYATIMQ